MPSPERSAMASHPDRGEILLTELQGDSRSILFSENVSAVQKLDFSDTMVQQKLDDIKDRMESFMGNRWELLQRQTEMCF